MKHAATAIGTWSYKTHAYFVWANQSDLTRGWNFITINYDVSTATTIRSNLDESDLTDNYSNAIIRNQFYTGLWSTTISQNPTIISKQSSSSLRKLYDFCNPGDGGANSRSGIRVGTYSEDNYGTGWECTDGVCDETTMQSLSVTLIKTYVNKYIGSTRWILRYNITFKYNINDSQLLVWTSANKPRQILTWYKSYIGLDEIIGYPIFHSARYQFSKT